MTPFWEADEAVSRWVAAHIPGCERGFGECRALGVVDRRGEMAAGVVFHDWNPERGLVELSCAAVNPRWLTRQVAGVCFAYAFDVARMAVTRTSERNERVVRIWRALGASEYRIADLWAPGEAAVLFTLTPQQWRASRLARHP